MENKNNTLQIGKLSVDLDNFVKHPQTRDEFIKSMKPKTETKDGKEVNIKGTGFEGDAGAAWDKIQEAIKQSGLKAKPEAKAEEKPKL